MSHHGGTFLFNTIPMENDFGISDFLRFALLTSVGQANSRSFANKLYADTRIRVVANMQRKVLGVSKRPLRTVIMVPILPIMDIRESTSRIW